MCLRACGGGSLVLLPLKEVRMLVSDTMLSFSVGTDRQPHTKPGG